MRTDQENTWHPQARACLASALHAGEAVALACSGGADSRALLEQVCEVFPKNLHQLHVLHYNHHTRLGASDEDADFVKSIAEEKGLLLYAEKALQAMDEASEDALRSARLLFFHRTMHNLGARILLTGHHRNDLAETLLMRLMRGSSLNGLVAPRAVQPYGDFLHVRLLLNQSKAEIVHDLQQRACDWREDASNQSHDYLRNRIRQEVMPVLDAVSDRDFSRGAARSRELLEEAEQAVEQWAADVFPDAAAQASMDLTRLKHLPKAVVRRVFENWLHGQGVRSALEAKSFDTCLEQIITQTPFVHTISQETQLCLREGALVIEESEPIDQATWEHMLICETTLYFPWHARLQMDCLDLDDTLKAHIFSGQVNPSQEAYLALEPAALRVRTWQAGDRYRPLGAPGQKKLQDLFIDKKIPRDQKHRLPVICNSKGDIVWIPHFAPAQACCLRPESSVALRLTYESGS